jgi:hypothetical protein
VSDDTDAEFLRWFAANEKTLPAHGDFNAKERVAWAAWQAASDRRFVPVATVIEGGNMIEEHFDNALAPGVVLYRFVLETKGLPKWNR